MYPALCTAGCERLAQVAAVLPQLPHPPSVAVASEPWVEQQAWLHQVRGPHRSLLWVVQHDRAALAK